MRRLELFFLSIAFSGLFGCASPLPSQRPPRKLTAGFWFWQGGSADVTVSGGPLDVLFVHVGTIRKETPPLYVQRTGGQWHVYGSLTGELPAARKYWLVFRFEQQGVPDLQVAPMVAQEVSLLWADAQKRRLSVAGVQLDIDSPTSSLTDYANFLREVRKGLPQGCEVSITALLDWFRSGTAIGEVVKAVDEFVPQFYDLADRTSYDGGAAIAARIDAMRWGPVFNRFRKRFRLGISTFGRARIVRAETPPERRYDWFGLFRDLAPIDIATNSAFQLQAERNQANELVLSYRAARKTRIGYTDFVQGDTIQFTLATPESVRSAIEAVQQIGGYLVGVVFFRWPSSNEALAMQPDEVLNAAGLPTPGRQVQSRVEVVDGLCAAVECVDVYLEAADPFSPKPERYHIRTSTDLEYFLPESNVPIRMTGASQLELLLPPYCGRARLYLGRAVTQRHSEYTVEEGQ